MHSTVCGTSNSPSTVKNINEVLTDSNQSQSAVSDQNQTSPVVSPPNTVRKAATDHDNQLSCPGQMDPAVSTKCQNYRLVSAAVSSVDKCVECLGLISSYKWLGYVCKDEIVFSDAEASASESDDCSTAVTATECGTVEPMDTDATIKEQVHDMEDFGSVLSVSSTVTETAPSSEGQDACEDQHRRVPKKVWLKAEVAAVLRHFRDHIQKGKLATKNECSKCKLVEGPVLAQRTVQNIRDFVRN
ncbi:uncharacterized protein LOC115415361 isoform X2 [Sphaeramia orbicularis]|uniref:uncharacterized protein LOC115415361 isoform X2 n=1 Tax=Sphaeramia orbicularis TaxID=375764 RepID=UPI00118062AA|nr:uncharacterized protein LOC115415361 isoform X2 [Sphaeramia orbicularis]